MLVPRVVGLYVPGVQLVGLTDWMGQKFPVRQAAQSFCWAAPVLPLYEPGAHAIGVLVEMGQY
jgi:hypothetical protein